MSGCIEALAMKLVIGITKRVIADALLGLERLLSANPKTYKFSSWHEDKVQENSHKKISALVSPSDYIQADWQVIDNVEYSGVSIVSNVKVVMSPSLGGYNHSKARKAMVFTTHLRPFKYPNSRGIDYTFKFIFNILKIINKPKKGMIPGTVALLGNRVFDVANYYHFWADVIADIWYIKNNIPCAELPDYYLVPFAGLEWQWDILDICGVRKNQVIPYDRFDVIDSEKLVIPIRDKGAVNLPGWLSHAIHEISGWSSEDNNNKRLVFISRADARHRRVINESVIRERLVNEGFEIHTLDGKTIREQQHLFASSSIICAPHGAALTNLIWCRPGTIVIEFLPENYLPPCFKKLAEQNGIVYYPYICRIDESEGPEYLNNIYISNNQVNTMLKVIWSSKSRCAV